MKQKEHKNEGWRGRIDATFQGRIGGVLPTVTDLRSSVERDGAVERHRMTIYFHHPSFESKGTHTRQSTRMMSVEAYPPDVFTHLESHMSLSMSNIVRSRAIVDDVGLRETAESIVYAELKENVMTVGGHQRKVKVPGMAVPDAGDMFLNKSTRLFRFDPYYFIESKVTESGAMFNSKEVVNIKASLLIETVHLMQPIFDSKLFGEVDHDKLFEHLLKIRMETLAGVWLIKPDYFAVMEYAFPDRWKQLKARAEKGLLG